MTTVRPTTAYARLLGKPGYVWYRIAHSPDRLYAPHFLGDEGGPYRDKTDAENAAHDAAKRQNLELEWVN